MELRLCSAFKDFLARVEVREQSKTEKSQGHGGGDGEVVRGKKVGTGGSFPGGGCI